MIDRLERLVHGIGVFACCVLLPAQIGIAVFYIVARQFIGFPLTPLQELEWHFFFALVFLCLGMTHVADRNVRIDILSDRFSARARARIEVAGFFVALLPLTVAMIYYGTDAVISAVETMERSRAGLGLPYRWIIKSTIPLGGLLLLVAGALVTIRNIEFLRQHPAGQDAAGMPPAAPHQRAGP